MEITTIRISKETADRLVRRKTYGLSYDDVIKKLLDLDDLVMRESNNENKYKAKD